MVTLGGIKRKLQFHCQNLPCNQVTRYLKKQRLLGIAYSFGVKVGTFFYMEQELSDRLETLPGELNTINKL